MSIETKTQNLAELRAEQAALNARPARAEQDLARARQARADEPLPGSKVLITVTFPGSSDEYEYLALRTSSRSDGLTWYVTGQKGRLDWDGVLRLVERGTYTIYNLRFI